MNCSAGWKNNRRTLPIGRENDRQTRAGGVSPLRESQGADAPRSDCQLRASRRVVLGFTANLQIAGAGLEEAAAALAGARSGFLLERLQIGEVGHAVRAADGVQMEVDVILLVFVEHLQQV